MVKLDKRQNVPLKPEAVPTAIAASARIIDMAMAKAVGINSREKSIMKIGCYCWEIFLSGCLRDGFVDVVVKDVVFSNISIAKENLAPSLYFVYSRNVL